MQTISHTFAHPIETINYPFLLLHFSLVPLCLQGLIQQRDSSSPYLFDYNSNCLAWKKMSLFMKHGKACTWVWLALNTLSFTVHYPLDWFIKWLIKLGWCQSQHFLTMLCYWKRCKNIGLVAQRFRHLPYQSCVVNFVSGHASILLPMFPVCIFNLLFICYVNIRSHLSTRSCPISVSWTLSWTSRWISNKKKSFKGPQTIGIHVFVLSLSSINPIQTHMN